MELTLGPVLFHWKKSELYRFYEEAAGMPVDRVYIGEVICRRRFALSIKDMETIGNMLVRAGKDVVISTPALVSNEGELAMIRDAAVLPFPMEANDMSVFNMVGANIKEICAGPHIMAYNREAIEFLKTLGVKRITFPVEHSRDSIAYNIKNTGITAEVFAHGKLPLAFSWRCYTSRAHGLKKADCRSDCALYADGMEIKTLDGEPVFTINGTSVLSALPATLVEFIADLKEIGVRALRISPDYKNTKKTVEIYKGAMERKITPKEALRELEGIYGTEFSNGWYAGGPGREYVCAGIIDGRADIRRADSETAKQFN